MKQLILATLTGDRSKIGAVYDAFVAANVPGWTAPEVRTSIDDFGGGYRFWLDTTDEVALDNGVKSTVRFYLALDRDGDRATIGGNPAEPGFLEKDVYNGLVRSLCAALEPFAEREGVTIDVEKDVIGPTDLLSVAGQQAFQRVSSAPDRSLSHPADSELMDALIIQCHLEGSTMDSTELSSFLQADEWPAEYAQEAGIRYLRGRKLLKRYDARLGE